MFMFDPRFGEMDVEIEIPDGNPRKAYIAHGYKLENFQDLTEEELEFLNEEYEESIIQQAAAISSREDYEALKYYH